MSLGIFVVGRSDKDVIPILLRKLGQTVTARRVVPQGDMLNADTMETHIRLLKATRRGLTRILILMDSEGVDPEVTRQRTQPPQGELNRRIKRPQVDYVVVDHSLEGWLACDSAVLLGVLGSKARIPKQAYSEVNNPQPVRWLERVFERNGRDFRKTTHDVQLAERADVNVICQRSPTFAWLAALLGSS